MMKSMENAKSLKKELIEYEEVKRGKDDNEENPNDELFGEEAQSTSTQQHEHEEMSDCFGCTFSFLNVLLKFINETASIEAFNKLYLNNDFMSKLYNENMKMFAASQRTPTRLALCKIVSKEKESTKMLLKMIENAIYSHTKKRNDCVPHHMLSSIIHEDIETLVSLLTNIETLIIDEQTDKYNEAYNECLEVLVQILKYSIDIGSNSAPVASELISNSLQKIHDLLKVSPDDDVLTLMKNDSDIDASIKRQLGKVSKNLKSESVKKFVEQYKKKKVSLTPEIESILKIGKIIKVDPKLVHNFSDNDCFENIECIMKCLLIRTSNKCRHYAQKILKDLVSKSDVNYYKLLSMLKQYLNESLKNEEVSEQFFELLNELLDKPKIEEIVKKNQENEDLYLEILSELFSQISFKCDSLVYVQKQKERLGSDGLFVDLNQGKGLNQIIKVVSSMIKVDFIKKEFKGGAYTYATIKSLLNIRKCFLLKNKTLINCEKEMTEMFKQMSSDSEEEKQQFIIACLKLLEDSDKLESTFLYEHIKNIIHPVKAIPNYTMNLHKHMSHDMYLRGRMSKNPYSSKDMENNTKNILEKICQEHEMMHALELIEMVMCNNIITPGLQIHLVYEKYWYPYSYKQRNPDADDVPPIDTVDKSYIGPMEIVYRLAGVDGEATENRIESIQDDEEVHQDPEKKFALAKTLAITYDETKSGLKILLEGLKKIESVKRDGDLLINLLTLFQLALKIKDNVTELVKLNGADVLVDKLFVFLSEGLNDDQQKIIDQVINCLETIVVHASNVQLATSEQDMEIDLERKEKDDTTIKNVSVIIDKVVTRCEKMIEDRPGSNDNSSTNDQIVAISRILPFLANKNKEAETMIAEMFLPHLKNLEMLEEENQTKFEWKDKFTVEYYCERLLNCLESAQNSINDTFTEKGIVDELCRYVSSTLTDNVIGNEEILLFYEKPLALTLKSLALYLKAHAKSQELLLEQNKANNIIVRIFELSRTKLKERNLSILAEGVIDSLVFKSELNHAETYNYVKDMVKKQDDDKKKKAMRKKKAMLAKMKKPGKGIRSKIKLDQVKEEKGITCIICQEGYQTNQSDLIGVYVFVRKINISPDKVMGLNEDNGYSTVTHFNSIHFKCHRNAYDADCNRKKALSEWEGAQIRNSHTKCNALFPIKGGSINEDGYKQYLNEYYNNIGYSIYSLSTPRIRVMFNDIKSLFKRLAFEESFSKYSQGGGAEHNINLIPLMIHMTLTMLKDGDDWKSPKQVKDVSKYIETTELADYEFLEKAKEKKAEDLLYEEEAKEEGNDPEVDEFDVMAKITADRVENWMYWTLIAAVLANEDEWKKYQTPLFEIGAVLARVNGRFLPASEKIFILSEETKDQQNEASAKSSTNKYANSVKKILLYFALAKIFRSKFIGQNIEETVEAFNSIKTHEKMIDTCQEIFSKSYTQMLDSTGKDIYSRAFTEEEQSDEALKSIIEKMLQV